MVLPTTGPMFMSAIRNEFNVPQPVAMSSLYRGDTYVTDISANNKITGVASKKTAPISFVMFRGAQLAPPTPVITATTSASTNTLTITWVAQTATHVDISWRPLNIGNFTTPIAVAVSASPYVITSLYPSSTYEVKLTPKNTTTGISGDTYAVPGTATAGPLTVGTFSAGTVTPNSIEVNWTSGNYKYAIISILYWPYSYTVYPNDRSYTLTNLQSDKNYTITITPYNAENIAENAQQLYNIRTLQSPVIIASVNSQFTIWTEFNYGTTLEIQNDARYLANGQYGIGQNYFEWSQGYYAPASARVLSVQIVGDPIFYTPEEITTIDNINTNQPIITFSGQVSASGNPYTLQFNYSGFGTFPKGLYMTLIRV